MVKIKVSGQVNVKAYPYNLIVQVGSKWFSTARFINDVKPGDNVLINGYWYTIEKVQL